MTTKEKPKKFRAIIREAAEFACGGGAVKAGPSQCSSSAENTYRITVSSFPPRKKR
jgi:hypothetical protein